MKTRGTIDSLENKIFTDGGFTYDPKFGFMEDSPESREHFKRFIVGVRQISVLACDLPLRTWKNAVNIANRDNLYIGAWMNEKTGLKYWDFCQGYDNHIQALRIARERGELAIFDSHYMVSIDVETEEVI